MPRETAGQVAQRFAVEYPWPVADRPFSLCLPHTGDAHES